MLLAITPKQIIHHWSLMGPAQAVCFAQECCVHVLHLYCLLEATTNADQSKESNLSLSIH